MKRDTHSKNHTRDDYFLIFMMGHFLNVEKLTLRLELRILVYSIKNLENVKKI